MKSKRKRTKIEDEFVHPIEVVSATITMWVKPCPFCGCRDKVDRPYITRDGNSMPDDGPFWVQCAVSKCSAHGPLAQSQDGAASFWNERR